VPPVDHHFYVPFDLFWRLGVPPSIKIAYQGCCEQKMLRNTALIDFDLIEETLTYFEFVKKYQISRNMTFFARLRFQANLNFAQFIIHQKIVTERQNGDR
jgi:hypothetical protein